MSDLLDNLIKKADSKIDEVVFSPAEKEALRNVALTSIESVNAQSKSEFIDSSAETSDNGHRDSYNDFSLLEDNKAITEEEVLEQLKMAENRFAGRFVGLRKFVTDILKREGYNPKYMVIIKVINFSIEAGGRRQGAGGFGGF